MEISDVIVVGGGLFGSATAYGLRQHGLDAAVIDDGDDALRAARGNFSLVWLQSKGLGMQRYHDWSRESAHLHHDFTAELKECGGMYLLLGETPPGFENFNAKRLNAENGYVSTHH